jgi:7-cyano-7-deazaguanine synthase
MQPRSDQILRMRGLTQQEPALVLFSGGQDSTTCLAWALDRFAAVETIGFDYGQRHRVELDCRERIAAALRRDFPQWRDRLGPDHLIDLSILGQVSDTALTRDSAIAFAQSGLPNTFVPGRNLLFFTFAAAVGYRRGLRHLVGGMCETDYSGYPDCRDDTLKALQATLSLGMDHRFAIHTPLMWRDKAATWVLAQELGGGPLVELIRRETHSCYLGDRSALHDWGYGCGACPACDLRRNGWEAYRAALDSGTDGDASTTPGTPDTSENYRTTAIPGRGRSPGARNP